MAVSAEFYLVMGRRLLRLLQLKHIITTRPYSPLILAWVSCKRRFMQPGSLSLFRTFCFVAADNCVNLLLNICC
jgi:hypothetical protein